MAKEKEKKKERKDKFLAELEKEIGEEYISTATERSEEHHGIKIPTGNPVVDLLTGGGYRVGLVYELAGKKGAGKSTMALLAVAEAQRLGGRVLYIDAEQTLSDRDQLLRAQHLGVDLDSLYIVRPQTLERGMHALSQAIQLSHRDEIPFVLVVWDTIAFTPTEAEYKNFAKGDDQADMAAARRAVKLRGYMRSMIQMCEGSKACILSLAHVTTNIMAGYGAPTDTIPGGSAFQFGASMQIIMRSSNAKDNQMLDAEDKFGGKDSYRGSLVVYKLEKTRLSPPRREVSAWLDVFNGIDKALTMLDYFLDRKHLITEEGRKLIFPTPEGMAPVEITTGDAGRVKFKEAYDASPEFRDYLFRLAEADYNSAVPWLTKLVEAE